MPCKKAGSINGSGLLNVYSIGASGREKEQETEAHRNPEKII